MAPEGGTRTVPQRTRRNPEVTGAAARESKEGAKGLHAKAGIEAVAMEFPRI
ncbi:hypothetical protein GCM10027432_28590 [Lysobacter fragariae]